MSLELAICPSSPIRSRGRLRPQTGTRGLQIQAFREEQGTQRAIGVPNEVFRGVWGVLTLVAQDPRFDTQSRLVLVPVTVTDSKGRTVDGLDSKHFILLDNGRPQKATLDTIGTGVAPIALVIAIQASGISKPVLEKVRTIGAMIQPLITGDQGCAAVVSFSERIVWLQEFTRNVDALERAFREVRPGAAKSARMLDTVYESIERLRQQPNSRRVLLLISESRDRGSDKAFEQVAIAAQTAGVTVYSASYSAFKTALTTKSSAIAEPLPPKVPQKPSDQTGTVTGGPPACNPLSCTTPELPASDQRVDMLGGIGELARLGKNQHHSGTGQPDRRHDISVRASKKVLRRRSRSSAPNYILSTCLALRRTILRAAIIVRRSGSSTLTIASGRGRVTGPPCHPANSSISSTTLRSGVSLALSVELGSASSARLGHRVNGREISGRE